MHEWARGPGIWTVAHRGYSGYRRLDLWAYPPDEAAALKAAARLGIECGLDEDQAAVDAYARHDYRAVLNRHRETAPEWQILTVELTYFVGDNDELVATSAGVDPYTSLDYRTPGGDTDAASGEDRWGGTRAADDEELALMENGDEYSEIVELISSRQATLIANAADEIAAAIRSDADTLGSGPVTPRSIAASSMCLRRCLRSPSGSRGCGATNWPLPPTAWQPTPASGGGAHSPGVRAKKWFCASSCDGPRPPPAHARSAADHGMSCPRSSFRITTY